VPGLLEPLRYFAGFALAGFHALLQTTGYNIPFLDLENVTPDEVAEAVLFLCLPESGSINGRAIAVDGGETM